MKVHVITVCHMNPDIIAFSVMRGLMTKGRVQPATWLFVDNRWPIRPVETTRFIEDIAKLAPNHRIIRAEKNLGGHGGFNFGVKYLREYGLMEKGDLVLWYDPDSAPRYDAHGWLDAMVNAMETDPKIATLSLWPADLAATDFMNETVGGENIRTFPTHAEMFSVTMWREDFIGDGVEAMFEHYGQIEAPAYRRAQGQGKRNAWLQDFREEICPIPHPKSYENWKNAHVAGDKRNFDEYLAAHHEYAAPNQASQVE